jgi:peptidoglycan/LPS O-acetylase OafA/YrhL
MSIMIPGLDGLRGVAFLLVFALHTGYLEIGWVGVSLFFVLSGFLITGILLDMKKSLTSKEYFFKFYGRRFLRIFPLYYFYLLLAGLLTTWLISIHYRPRYMQTATALTATLLAASISYSLLERPILDLKDRFFPLKQSKKQENVLAATVEL